MARFKEGQKVKALTDAQESVSEGVTRRATGRLLIAGYRKEIRSLRLELADIIRPGELVTKAYEDAIGVLGQDIERVIRKQFDAKERANIRRGGIG